MSKKKKIDSPTLCIAYLATKACQRNVERKEEKQLRYLRDYAKGHNIKITHEMHKDIMGQNVVNAQWKRMVDMIKVGTIEGILVANMQLVSASIPDAFYKIGQVYEAGGIVYSVDEGSLWLPIKIQRNGKMVMANGKEECK